MIADLLRGGDPIELLLGILYSLPGILLALSFHELAHGYVAYKLGDSTAKSMGRLSMNPLHHVEPIGFLSLLLLGFGWAKPVMVDYRNLKNPKRDMAFVSLAGPLANFLLSWICYLIYYLVICLAFPLEGEGIFAQILLGIVTILEYAIVLNVNLGLFNLIPVPPLDGSKILYAFLPAKVLMKIAPYERYSWIVLVALLYFRILSVPLAFLSDQILSFFYFTIEKVLFFL